MRKKRWASFLITLLLAGFAGSAAGCGAGAGIAAPREAGESETGIGQMAALTERLPLLPPVGNCRTTYEIFVYSFCDSDGDGIGDLQGVISRLDYIADMGFDQIWLMPICPSPSYHKYDVTDYFAVDPQYGTLEDFDELIREAGKRDIRVLTDLVLNHTSTEHPWFREAADYLRALPEGEEPSAEDCPALDCYQFSAEKQAGYEPLGDTGFYYEARFWSGMPDLNLDSSRVREGIAEVLRFWLERGAAGFRLDACTSYYADDIARNVAFLSWLKQTAEGIRPDCYFVGEAWANQQVYARYYESGIDSFFDFAFADAEGLLARTAKSKYSALQFAEAMEEEQTLYGTYSESYVNAPFYTNHDMNRSAGYYAGDDGACAKFAGGLNLMMGGNAFVYYGEELGMKGSGRDENRRAPMYWSEDPDAEGMTDGPPEMESISMKFPPMQEQSGDPASILRYFRTAVHIRRSFPAIAGGTVRVIRELSDEDSCALLRELPGGESVLLVYHTAEETRRMELGTVCPEYRSLGAVLCVAEEPVLLEGDVLTLPGRSIVVLTAGGGGGQP